MIMHTLILPLNVTDKEDALLNKRFNLLAREHNILVKHAKFLLKRIHENKWYQKNLTILVSTNKRIEEIEKYLADPKTEKVVIKALKAELKEKKALSKQISTELSDYRERIGLTKTGLEKYAKKFQNKYKHHISSHISQNEVNHVWAGVEKVLFDGSKDIHYKKFNDLRTIGSKSAKNGICFYDKTLNISYTKQKATKSHKTGIIYMGLDLEVVKGTSEKEIKYETASLMNKVKTCAIKREMFAGGWRYYLILTLDGDAPKKFEMGNAVAGNDPGVSTFAYVSDNCVAFEELAPRCKEYNKQIAELQRKIDRSKRKSNPNNYNENGTIKKGKHTWVLSNNCKKLKRKLKILYRKKREYTRHEHNYRANRVIQDASTFITEEMDFAALAKRSKKDAERSEKETVITLKDGTTKTVHKFKKKKRYGKSINDRSPTLQLQIIQRKMAQYCGFYYEVNTKKYKASQYDHIKNECIKVPLAQRFKDIGGHIVQRDLYSAFLIRNSSDDLQCINTEMCIATFGEFLKNHDACIQFLKENDFHMPGCVGF